MLGNLNSSLTGLNTSQSAIENVMNNIANENSEGYIKRVANLNELNNSDTTYNNGVGISSIERQVNEYLLMKIQDENSMQSYYSTNSSIYNSLETSLLETDTSGLSVSMDNYFQSLENFRSNPNSEIYKSEFISDTNSFIYELQDIYSDLEQQQGLLKDEMYTQVDDVNKIINEIASINENLKENEDSLDLLDRRDYLISELSQYGNIEITDTNDYFQIKLAGESVVFNNTANELNVEEEYLSQKNIYDNTDLNDSNITNGETISLTLNNEETISIVADTTGTSDYDVKQQIVDEINLNSNLNNTVQASLDENGNLIIESRAVGEESSFGFEIKFDNSNTVIEHNDAISQISSDDVSIQIFDKKLEFKSGSLKALDENTSTLNTNNIFYQTQNDLNNLANSLIENSKSYEVDLTTNYMNLFSGSNVMTMSLNEENIDNLSQEDLDYLASLQFEDGIKIDNFSDSEYSFSEYLIGIKVNVAMAKENTDFKLQTQDSIVMSLQNSYDQISKVDVDEEMINLMQYQAAYEANAKVITAMDEMIQTILAM